MPISAGDNLANCRYQVTQYLGEGTWGVVYLADDVRMGRKVAIKLLRKEVVHLPTEVRRFEREPVITAKIGDHPNIVNVYDFAREQHDTPTGTETLYYSVMEYVSEGSLRNYLRDCKRLPILEAIDFATDICQALDEIHANNIVHCDLKPGNIMLKRQLGRVVAKVADFGNAYVPNAKRSNATTPTGAPRGTFQYSSPEQLKFEPGDADSGSLDGRSDLYALGSILYEMVTGSPPFVSDDSNYLFNLILNEAPELPTRHNAGVSEELENIILCALQKQPEARFSNAKEMLLMLQKVRGQEEASLNELEELFSVAEDHLARDDYHTALTTLRSIQNKNPVYKLADVTSRIGICEQNEILAENYRNALSANESRNWQKAVYLLEQIIDMDPDYDQGKAKELLVIVRAKAEAQQQLDKERKLEEQGDWETAAATLQEIIRDFASLIKSGELLEDVPRRYAYCQDRVKLEKLHSQVKVLLETAERSQQVEDWDKVINIYREMETLNPQSEEIKKLLEYTKQQCELAGLYRKGLAAQEKGDWVEAANYFERITHKNLRYRDAAILFADINKYLRCQQLYEEVKNHLSNQNWEDAKSAFSKIIEIKPDFQDCQALLRNLTIWIQVLELESQEAWTEAIKKLNLLTVSPFDKLAKQKLVIYQRQVKLDELYKRALTHYDHRDWFEAKNIFEEIQVIERSYKDVSTRLKEVRRHIWLVPVADCIAKHPIGAIISMLGALIVAAVIVNYVVRIVIAPPSTSQIGTIEVLINGVKIDPNLPYDITNQNPVKIAVQVRDANEVLMPSNKFTCRWAIGSLDWPDRACTIDYNKPADRNSQLIQVEVVKNDPETMSGDLYPIVFLLQSKGEVDER